MSNMMLDEEHVPAAKHLPVAWPVVITVLCCAVLCCAVLYTYSMKRAANQLNGAKVTDARNGSVAYTHAEQSSVNHYQRNLD